MKAEQKDKRLKEKPTGFLGGIMVKRMVKQMPSLYSLVVEHLPSKQEVTGSNPVTGFLSIHI